jgi:apolipoprotein N-acyltransferase
VRRPALLGLAGGVLLTLGLPPFGWWVLALVGAAVVARGLEEERRGVLALATGIGFLAPGLWWMTEFSLPGWALAMLLESAMVAVAIFVVPRGWRAWLGFPAALVLVDAVRGVWPFGGVPIATVAETQIGGPLLQTARLGGALLVTGLVAWVGLALARRKLLRLLPIVSLVILSSNAPDGRRVGEIDVAVVQGGGPRGTRAVDTDEREVFDRHLTASRGIPEGTGLVLWPEDVVDVEERVFGTTEGDELAGVARRNRTTLVAGVIEGPDDEPFRNWARSWSPTGRPGPSYEKNHRVPFGEYIPFRSLVERVADVSAVPRDMRPGEGPGILRTKAGDLGVVISFEVFFARRVRDAMVNGAEVLLVPTNASSYSSTQMPALELGAAQLRAVETGRAVVQAAPTGFSAVVDHRGDVRRRSDLGRRQVLTATVQRRSGDTPYTRLGDGPFVVLAALALLLTARRRSR